MRNKMSVIVLLLLFGTGLLGAKDSGSNVQALILQLQTGDADQRVQAADSLGLLGDTAAVEVLIAALGDEDADVRWHCADALYDIGDERAFEPLADASLNDKNWTVRGHAVDAAAEVGGERATDVLITAVGDRSWFVRAKAAWNLGYCGDERAYPCLRELFYRKKGTLRARFNPYSDCGAAMLSLGLLGDTSVVEDFIPLVGKGKMFLGMYAAMALGEMGDYRATPTLLEGLNFKGVFIAKGIKWACIESLGMIGDTSAVPALIGTLDDEDYANDAATALGMIGDPRAVESLLPMLESEEDYMRKDVAWALVEIGTDEAVDAVYECMAREDMAVVAGAHCYLIELGDEQTEDILIEALNEHGRNEMAENYLYCGNPRLEEAAREWADIHSRRLDENPDAPVWGGAED